MALGYVLLQCVFPSCAFTLSPAAGVLKADCTPLQLLSLSSSSSEQASTSKQHFSMEQVLYGASGSRDDIFSLGGTGYMTASKNCSSRTLGCVSDSNWELFLPFCLVFHVVCHPSFLMQGSYVGLWIWELRKLPSVSIGGSFTAATVEWRWVHCHPLECSVGLAYAVMRMRKTLPASLAGTLGTGAKSSLSSVQQN